MVKFRIGDKIGLGLSKLNVKKLKQGKPIVIDTNELGIPGHEIFIFYGDTEKDMELELKKMGVIGSETKYKSDFN